MFLHKHSNDTKFMGIFDNNNNAKQSLKDPRRASKLALILALKIRTFLHINIDP